MSARDAAQAPASYFVHGGAALFCRDSEWFAAPVGADGAVVWSASEPLDMPELLELADVLGAVRKALDAAANL